MDAQVNATRINQLWGHCAFLNADFFMNPSYHLQYIANNVSTALKEGLAAMTGTIRDSFIDVSI
jgi:hypothetical protein